MPGIGTKAPDFSLPDHNGQMHSLSDPDKEVLQAYDVWKERSMFGRTVMRIERSTYLIDQDGFF